MPVLRVGLSGLSEQELNDLGLNFVRPQFITVPGVSVPYPYGGKQRFVEVDLNYRALQGYGLTPSDVVNTITAQNLTLPAGTEKIGRFEYLVGLNSSPNTIEKLNAIPIKSLPNGTTVYIRDVANIVNGSIPQTNIVRFNGQRATMLDIQKTGNASTVYVDVPEPFTEFVKIGAQADLTVGQVPGRNFSAQVVGTAGAINPMAKRLLTELAVPNQTGRLFPGAYVQVTFKIEGSKSDLTIPAGALLFNAGKAAVGVVRPNGSVEIREIEIHRDLGSRLEISQGLSESDLIIASPPPGLADGTDVVVAKPT